MRNLTHFVIAVALLGWTAPASAQKPSAYPAKDQNAAQQAQDDTQCLAWAKQNTGIDPVAVAATPPPPTGPQGERLRGAARGAVIGEIIDDKAGEGAAIGALAGGRHARMNQAAKAQQAKAGQTEQIDTYYRAYGACMQGRGYSVS